MAYRVIIPCCHETGHVLWNAEESTGVISNFFAMASTLGLPVHMVSTDAHLVEKAQSMGLDGHLLPACQADDLEFPPGTREAVELVRGMPSACDDNLVILDPVNPLLQKETILNAIAEHETHSCPVLASVGTVRDHPCQFNRYMKLTDVIVYFALDAGDDGQGVSKPFSTDWEYAGVTADGLYSRVPGLFDSHFTHPDSADPVLWEKRGERARVVAGDSSKVHAWGAEDVPVKPILKSVGGQRYELSWESVEESTDSYSLWMVPFSGNKLGYEEAQFFGSGNSSTSSYLEPLKPGQVGWIGILSREVFGGHYDYSEPLDFPNASWKVVGSRLRINRENGQRILGRQDFPDVFEMDLSIVVVSPGVEIAPMGSYPVVEPFLLSDEERIRIRSSFDLLRLKAKELSRGKN